MKDISVDGPTTDEATLTYQHTGLTDGATYNYQVAAKNDVGLGDYSAEVSATTAKMSPGVPESFTASAVSPTQIDLDWVVPTNTGGSEIMSYELQVSQSEAPDSFTNLPISGTMLSYQHRDLDPGTTYYYQVAAINNIGRGAYSSVSSATEAATLSLSETTLSFDVVGGTEDVTITSNIAVQVVLLVIVTSSVPPTTSKERVVSDRDSVAAD